MNKKLLAVTTTCVGLAFIVAGIALVFVPAALVVGGMALCCVGLFMPGVDNG